MENEDNLKELLEKEKRILGNNKCEFFIDTPSDKNTCLVHSLLSLSAECKRINYGPPIGLITEAASSGEESDSETGGPSINKVVCSIFDAEDFVSVNEFCDLPRSQPPALIFTNLNSPVGACDLKKMLLGIKEEVKIDKIKMFTHKKSRGAFVEFENVWSARTIYNYYNGGAREVKNALGEPIKVNWGFQKSTLENSYWTGVILRNLPPNTSESLLKTNCTSGGEQIKRIIQPELIQGQNCALVVTQTIEDAEKICKRLNNYVFTETQKLKAHIHPYSCRKRGESPKSESYKLPKFDSNVSIKSTKLPSPIKIPVTKKTKAQKYFEQGKIANIKQCLLNEKRNHREAIRLALQDSPKEERDLSKEGYVTTPKMLQKNNEFNQISTEQKMISTPKLYPEMNNKQRLFSQNNPLPKEVKLSNDKDKVAFNLLRKIEEIIPKAQSIHEYKEISSRSRSREFKESFHPVPQQSTIF